MRIFLCLIFNSPPWGTQLDCFGGHNFICMWAVDGLAQLNRDKYRFEMMKNILKCICESGLDTEN